MSTKRRVNGSIEVKKEGKKAKFDQSASTHVTVRVQGQDEEELRVFRVRRNVKMRKLMELYNDVRGVEWGTYVFLSKYGSRIREYHTPNKMKLKDGDQIDAMLHQGGGGECISTQICCFYYKI